MPQKLRSNMVPHIIGQHSPKRCAQWVLKPAAGLLRTLPGYCVSKSLPTTGSGKQEQKVAKKHPCNPTLGTSLCSACYCISHAGERLWSACISAFCPPHRTPRVSGTQVASTRASMRGSRKSAAYQNSSRAHRRPHTRTKRQQEDQTYTKIELRRHRRGTWALHALVSVESHKASNLGLQTSSIVAHWETSWSPSQVRPTSEITRKADADHF